MTNETAHYAAAEKWLERAEATFEAMFDLSDPVFADFALRIANVHAQLAIAADVDREATAGQRLADCVPNGAEALAVSVRGR